MQRKYIIDKNLFNLRKTGNWLLSKNNSAFPSFIRNDIWNIFSTERENCVGWIVNIKKLIGWSLIKKNRLNDFC